MLDKIPTANGVTRQTEPEKFQVYGERELTASPMHTYGVCFNPDCSRPFNPTREWSMYCCTACERKGTNEMRKWGHKMALAMLGWRMTKYSKDKAEQDLCRCSRRYVTLVKSAWLKDRKDRIKAAKIRMAEHG